MSPFSADTFTKTDSNIKLTMHAFVLVVQMLLITTTPVDISFDATLRNTATLAGIVNASYLAGTASGSAIGNLVDRYGPSTAELEWCIVTCSVSQ